MSLNMYLFNWGHAKEKYRCPDDDSTEYRGYEVCIESAFAFWGHDALNSSPGKEFHLKLLRSLKMVIRLGLKLNSVDICHDWILEINFHYISFIL